MEETFEDEVLAFLMKAIVVAGAVYALVPPLMEATFGPQGAVPLAAPLYYDPDTGIYWEARGAPLTGRLYYDPGTETYWIYTPKG